MLQVRCMVMQRKEMGAHIEPVLVLTLLPLHLSEPPRKPNLAYMMYKSCMTIYLVPQYSYIYTAVHVCP